MQRLIVRIDQEYLEKLDITNALVFLTSAIVQTDYYRLLQSVRQTGEWEAWILYMLDSVEQTANESIVLIDHIKKLMQQYKQSIRTTLPKMYSQDLLNNLFKYPYTKIEYLENDLGISRSTAIRYLRELEKLKLLKKQKIGRDNFYINQPLFDLLAANK